MKIMVRECDKGFRVGENPTSSDTWTAKATYIFTDEGKYTVTISYTDKAGNVCKIAPKRILY